VARFNLIEFALALITLLTVALIGVEQGIAVAVVLAMLDRIRKSAQSQLAVLGRVAGTTSWTPLAADPDAAQQTGVLAVLFATPLWYANATHFREQMAQAVAMAPGTTRVVVLDAIGMADVDFTGARAFGRMLDACARNHVAFGVARAGDHLRETLGRSGLSDRIGAERFFSTVNEAVTTLIGEPGPPPA
jgi:SulP family sulfate permease